MGDRRQEVSLVGIINLSSESEKRESRVFLEKIISKFNSLNFENIFVVSSYCVYRNQNVKVVKDLNSLDGFKNFLFVDEKSPYINIDFFLDFHFKKRSLITLSLRMDNGYKEKYLISEDYQIKNKLLADDGYLESGIFAGSGLGIVEAKEKLNRKDFSKVYGIPFPYVIEDELKRVVFLDRDGIINEDTGYVYKIEELRLKDGIIDFLKALQFYFDGFIIVTNQAGIAKGKFTEEDYLKFETHLEEVLKKEGINIIDSFYCPFHKDGVVEKYKKDSLDRKPAPGMFLKAAEKYNVNLFESVMIGDKESDVIALPYLKSYILKGSYELKGLSNVYKNFDEIFEVILEDFSLK